MALALVLIIAGIATGAVIAFFLFKKSGHRLPTLDKLTAFDNPLFLSNEHPQPDVVGTNRLAENAEEENPKPVTV